MVLEEEVPHGTGRPALDSAHGRVLVMAAPACRHAPESRLKSAVGSGVKAIQLSFFRSWAIIGVYFLAG